MSLSTESHSPLTSCDRNTERANQLTHGFGFLLSILGAALIIPAAWQSQDLWRLTGCIIFAVTMVALYAASTLSHSYLDGPKREFFRMLDQICIFLFTAASMTAFVLSHQRTPMGWTILTVMWGLALTGIYFRVRDRVRTLPVALFIPMGWIPVFAIGRMYEVGQIPGLALVLGGALAYTGGFWFLVNDSRKPWFHAAWHMSTITGSLLHFLYLFHFVARFDMST